MPALDYVNKDGTIYEIVPEIAHLFSTSTSYAVGDCVIKDAVLYRFKTAHAAGAWIGTDAEAIEVGKELTDLKDEIEDISMYTLGLYPQKSVADVAVASFADGADDIPVKSLTVDITPVQSGSGDPSPSNVRPISGWTRSKVYDCGKNLLCMPLDVIKAANTLGTWNGNIYTLNTVTFDVRTDGNGYVTEIIVNGHPNTASGYWTDLNLGELCVKSGVTYKISTGTNGSTSTTYRLWTTSATAFPSGHRLSTDSNLGENIARDALTDERFLVSLSIFSSYTASNLVVKPMVYLGTITDTTFEPYKGHTYTIDWTTEAGTVYGGTLDVTSGVLTVTNGMIELDGTQEILGSSYSGNAYVQYRISELGNAAKEGGAYKSNRYKNYGSGATTDYISQYQESYPRILVRDSRFGVTITNNAGWNTWLASNHIQFMYELATPVTYQLTPTEVATILGQNNIFCDTGNINELTYRADLKAYIDAHVGS